MSATKKDPRNGRVLRRVLLVLLLAAIVSLALGKNLSQTLLDMAYARAHSIAVKTVNQAVFDTFQEGVSYEDLVTVRWDDQGHVTMLQANAARMNELSTRTALMAQASLNAESNRQVLIPLGSALGVKFLAGFGPSLTVRVLPVGSVSTEFVTEFESAGINQTRHKISLHIQTTVRLVLPTGSQRVDVSSDVPIAESIIVGLVPDSFVDVNNQDDMLNLLP